MLKSINVVPLAAESFGARSMCTLVETSDVRVLLDAGVSLCPIRFGLPPHPKEFEAIDRCRSKIANAASKAQVVTISHYHFDHHTPSFEDWLCNWTDAEETARQIYEGKTILAKNPRENINPSQRQRAWMFQQTSGKYAKEFKIADQNSFAFGGTRIRFSAPVPHGDENSGLGFVLMTTVECQGERFMFAPDVQGPMSTRTLQLILNERPQLLMIGGPPLYLVDFKVDRMQLRTALKSLEKIAVNVACTIVEHHLLRDEKWREEAADVFVEAEKAGNRILTAAEFSDQTNVFLESMRKKLYDEYKPSKEFEKWMRLDEFGKKRTRPPIHFNS